MSKTKIEWSEEVWNPATGCTKVSQGCKNCYAETLTQRYAGRPGWPTEFKPWTPANAAENVVLHPSRLEDPFKWKTPRRVFVNSMSDLFHEEIPDEFIDKVFAVMALTPQHTYQVLTKRPERMRAYMTKERTAHFDDGTPVTPRNPYHSADFVLWAETAITENAAWPIRKAMDDFPNAHEWDWPLPNVWLGVTVENQRWADERIPILLDTPAAVRFVSAEPLLGPVDLTNINWTARLLGHAKKLRDSMASDNEHRDVAEEIVASIEHDGHDHPALLNALTGWRTDGEDVISDFYNDPYGRTLNWVIVGGESGSKHRPFDPDWARSIVSQCKNAGVAAFVKQLGGFRPGNALEDLPEDLRVREFPR